MRVSGSLSARDDERASDNDDDEADEDDDDNADTGVGGDDAVDDDANARDLVSINARINQHTHSACRRLAWAACDSARRRRRRPHVV
jgi:hypothetical protein